MAESEGVQSNGETIHVPSTSSILKEKISSQPVGSSILKEGTNKISAEGKNIASSIFASILSEGRSTDELKEGIMEVRNELKNSLAARKKELRAQIKERLVADGLKEKGKIKEFNALVREQLASSIAKDALVVSVAETRKLLTSINQRARIHALREAVSTTTAHTVLEQITAQDKPLAPQLAPQLEPDELAPSPAQTELASAQPLDQLDTATEEEAPVVSFDTVSHSESSSENRLEAEAADRAKRLQKGLDAQIIKAREKERLHRKRLGWKQRVTQRVMAAAVVLSLMGTVAENAKVIATDSPREVVPTQTLDTSLTSQRLELPETTVPQSNYHPIVSQNMIPPQDPQLNTSEIPQTITQGESIPPPLAEGPHHVEMPVIQVSANLPQPHEVSEPKENVYVNMNEKVQEIIAEYQKKNIDVAISVRDIESGEMVVGIKGDRVDTGASTVKVYVAAAVFDAVNKGDIRLDQKVGNYTVEQLMRLMINQSDNVAWKTLYGLIGKSRIENFAHVHGATNFDIANNYTSSDDLATFLSNVYKGDVIPENQKDLLFSWMQGGTTSREDLLTPVAQDSNLPIIHKWGLYGNMIGDAAIVTINGKPYAIVIMAGGKPFMNDAGAFIDGKGMNERVTAIHRIGEILVDGILGAEANTPAVTQHAPIIETQSLEGLVM